MAFHFISIGQHIPPTIEHTILYEYVLLNDIGQPTYSYLCSLCNSVCSNFIYSPFAIPWIFGGERVDYINRKAKNKNNEQKKKVKGRRRTSRSREYIYKTAYKIIHIEQYRIGCETMNIHKLMNQYLFEIGYLQFSSIVQLTYFGINVFETNKNGK